MLDRNSIKKIHCIGIGGIGVSGLAEFLARRGFEVSGSDVKANKVTERLQRLGIKVFIGHDAAHLDDPDVVVYSSAIKPDNPEFKRAKEIGVHLLRRAEMLAELMFDAIGILVSGTHGKTTTTSLITAILQQAGLDPSYMIGGLFNNMESPAGLGTGSYFVAEADESDASFLELHPTVAVVTNIEADHMNTYHDSFAELENTFVEFLHKLPSNGLAILGIDNPAVVKLQASVSAQVSTFGFSEDADFRATDFAQHGQTISFNLQRPEKSALPISLSMPGKHNVLNALAAIAVAHYAGVEDAAIQEGLAKFSGVGRRFHLHGELKLPQGGTVSLVDDYGHHPSAVRATIEAARLAWPGRRIVLAFQPHRYSRTQHLFADFVSALSEADALILTEVFAAGEQPIAGADGRALAEAVQKNSNIEVIFAPSVDDVLQKSLGFILDLDVLILQGAGDIGTLVSKLTESGQ